MARTLARRVANVVGSHPEDAEGSEISQQAHELAGAMQKTTEDALRIAQKAVERASKIAQAPSGGSGHAAGRGASEWGRRNDLSRPGRAARADPRVSEDPSRGPLTPPDGAGDRAKVDEAPATPRAAGA